MKTTKHARMRMSQRGIQEKIADIVYRFGETRGDKITLDPKLAKRLIAEMEKDVCALKKCVDQKGATLVLGEDGGVITAYRFEGRAA